ncbi:MAG: DNA polymerase [Synergistaceae bacterium]|jgi:DNA polymerase I-like protein with 3'-5' exonuclease and polymerase domains
MNETSTHGTYQYRLWDDVDPVKDADHDIFMEITDQKSIPSYCPVSENRLSRALYDAGVMEFEIDAKVSDAIGVFKEMVTSSLRSDTLVVFPCHFSAKYGRDRDTYSRKHRGMFTEILSCLRNREGQRPRILCLKDIDPRSRHSHTGKWVNDRAYQDTRNPIPKSQSIRSMPLDDELLKADHVRHRAGCLKIWLKDHPEIKKLVFPSTALAVELFPAHRPPESLREAAYRVYDFGLMYTVDGVSTVRHFDVTYIPSVLNHIKYEDKCYDLTADMLSIIMNPKPAVKVRKKIIRTVKEAAEVADYFAKKGQELSIDLETTGRNPAYPQQSILSAAVSDGKRAWIFLVRHPRYPQYDGLDMLKCFFGRADLTLVLQNAVYDFKWYTYFTGEYPACNVRDTMLLDHWLYEGQGSIGANEDSEMGAHNMGLGFGYSMDTQIPRYLRFPSHKQATEKLLEKLPCRNPYREPGGLDRERITAAEARKLIEIRMSDSWLEPNSGKYAELNLLSLLRYNGDDSGNTMMIYKEQCRRIDAECGGREKWPVVITDLMPALISNTVEMELNGAPVNYDAILDKIQEVSVLMLKLRGEVEGATGHAFNLDSPVQLKDYLIHTCHIHPERFYDIKKDKDSTEIGILEKMKKDVPWMDNYLSYKKAAKMKNTYLIPILLKSYKGVLYFGIKLTGTVTGRLSSWGPNIQNLPKYFEIAGRKIGLKEVIEAPAGKTFVDMDLSSAEVKVLTVVCPDPTLIDVLKKGLDPHSFTAALVSETSPRVLKYDEVRASHKKADAIPKQPLTADDVYHIRARQNAKRVTFGCIYRIGPRGLAGQLKFDFTPPPGMGHKAAIIKRQETGEALAGELLDTLFTRIYPYLPKVFAQKDAEVFLRNYGESIFGRRRRYHYTMIPVVRDILVKSGLYIPAGNRSDLFIKDCLDMLPTKRAFRQNLNFEVQSPTSDYMQYFIAYIRRECRKAGISVKFHFTVHDSAVFSIEAKPETYTAFKKICDEGMNVYLMSLSDKLPVVIGYDIGTSNKYCEIV